MLTAYTTLLLEDLIGLPLRPLKLFVRLISSSQNKSTPTMTRVAKADLAHHHPAYHQHLLPLTILAQSHHAHFKLLFQGVPDEAVDAARSRLNDFRPLLTQINPNKHDLGPDPGLDESGHSPNANLHTTPRWHTIPQAASIGLTRVTASSKTAPTGICS